MNKTVVALSIAGIAVAGVGIYFATKKKTVGSKEPKDKTGVNDNSDSENPFNILGDVLDIVKDSKLFTEKDLSL